MKRSQGWIAVLPSLVIPICFGLILYMGLLVVMGQGYITNETAVRYISGHPISKLTLVLFFVGVASLTLIAVNLFKQFSALDNIELVPATNALGEDSAATASMDADADLTLHYLEQLDGASNTDQSYYLWSRLNDAVHHVDRNGPNGLTEHLQYLAVQDQEFQEQKYSLVRILIWATPMLGFLGTVLGISAALGSIDVGPDNDFAKMMTGLRGSLYVAFDTTALALILSMILMFGQFLVDRFESQLLRNVESRSMDILSRCFELDKDGGSATGAMERIGKTVLLATHEVVQKQTELWERSMKSAERAWVDSVTGANQAASENLETAVDRAVENMAHYLGQTIGRADESFEHRWNQWQVSLGENVRRLREHQHELVTQTDLVHQLLAQISDLGKQQIETEDREKVMATNAELESTLKELSTVLGRLDDRIAIENTEVGTGDHGRGNESAIENLPELHVIDSETGEIKKVAHLPVRKPVAKQQAVNSILKFTKTDTRSPAKKSA